MVPTNAAAPTVGRSLVAEAKLAIAAGDRAKALALLDGLRSATTDEGRQLAPALAEALVATARGESDDESDRQALGGCRADLLGPASDTRLAQVAAVRCRGPR